MSYLRGDSAEAWEREENLRGRDNTTWEEFIDFLGDLMGDPDHRRITHLEEYHAMRQEGDESITKFLNRLSRVEDHISPMTQEQLVGNLYVHFNGGLRDKIAKQGLPKTRKDLAALATRLQTQGYGKANNKDKARASATGERNAPSYEKPAGSRPSQWRQQLSPRAIETNNPNHKSVKTKFPYMGKEPISEEERSRRATGNLCYRCGLPNHRAAQCGKGKQSSD
ncbi:MAG: hypothetical protein M1837_001294 [Sclerophora amabilis]|nr:MAG: hypothetical protein M1837_001294 [Sclerophora amabilis]